MPAETEQPNGRLACMDERLTERHDKRLCSRHSRMRMQVIKWVHSIFRLEPCLLTYTEVQRTWRKRGRQTKKKRSLTQIAVIVSVPQAKRGEGVKNLRWGRGPQVPSLKPGGVEGEEKSGRGRGEEEEEEGRQHLGLDL